MKKLLAALALAAFIASPAVAAPKYQPSYHCAPTKYDSEGTAVAQYCDED
jgi:hypothetical protein